MAAQRVLPNCPRIPWPQTGPRLKQQAANHEVEAGLSAAAAITKAASQQTYFTIRFLVDADRVQDAFRAYAYFRWVDDRLDEPGLEQSERVAFVERQQALMNDCYRGLRRQGLSLEEQLLADLIHSDWETDSGLQAYIRHMMAVMVFDTHRRGGLISEEELEEYSLHLATAVTEALHYFIGHDDATPQGKFRYFAVIAAHITHMLRDTLDDLAAGYFNIPGEFLVAQQLNPGDVHQEAYRAWVKSRVELARSYFAIGRSYLAQVENRRCRLAGYAYMARFEGVLAAIEREGYRLRADYPERHRLSAKLRLVASVINRTFRPAPVMVFAGTD